MTAAASDAIDGSLTTRQSPGISRSTSKGWPRTRMVAAAGSCILRTTLMRPVSARREGLEQPEGGVVLVEESPDVGATAAQGVDGRDPLEGLVAREVEDHR